MEAAKSDVDVANANRLAGEAQKQAEQAGKDAAESYKDAALAKKQAGEAAVLTANLELTNAQLSLQIEAVRSNNLMLEANVVTLKLQMQETARTANETRAFVNESNTIQRLNEEQAALAKAGKVAADVGSIVTNSNLGVLQGELSQIKPRSFTDDQIRTGISVLGLYNGIHVNIESALGDSDATHLSDQLTDLLNSSGWKASGHRRAIWHQNPGGQEVQGVEVYVYRDGDMQAASALINFLKKCDIQAQGFRPQTSDDSDILVLVGPK